MMLPHYTAKHHPMCKGRKNMYHIDIIMLFFYTAVGSLNPACPRVTRLMFTTYAAATNYKARVAAPSTPAGRLSCHQPSEQQYAS